MAKPPPPDLVIGIASSALFDLSTADAVYRQDGVEAYRAHQRTHEREVLAPGPAFPFIRRLLSLNRDLAVPVVEIVLISHNDADTGLRVRLSCEEHRLRLGRMAFTGGRAPWPFLDAFGTHLFLTRNAADVNAAIAAGAAAGEILPTATQDDDGDELRIAFDFDSVLADDSSDRIYAREGLAAFYAHEADHAEIPSAPGPLIRLLRAIAVVQGKLRAASGESRLRTAIVTARNWPADRRVVTTLRAWGLPVDEAYFLGDAPKEPVLRQLRPHIFFDDRRANVDRACFAGPAVHVPFGINNREIGGA